MADAAAYASNMIRALAASDPDLDTQIGSVTRKIIDAVAEQLAEVTIDSQLLNATFDLNSKLGADLDDFVLMFGYTRLPPHRATGVITLTRATPATENIPIPFGTQVATASSPQVIFSTAVTTFMPVGAKTVDVPIQAVEAGASGNLPGGSLTTVLSQFSDIGSTSVQANPTTGGVASENDDALKDRFRKTLFRSSAGTGDMYLAMALEAGAEVSAEGQQVTRANVLGASSKWRERIQIGANGLALSTLTNSSYRYVFPGSSVLGEDIEAGRILTPDVHYTFQTTDGPVPVIRILNDSVPADTILDLEFEYSPKASRNDPLSGITNRIDIYCDGQIATEAAEITYFTATNLFIAGDVGKYAVANFNRQGSGSPTAGNVFLRLSYGPILTFPDSLTISGAVYVKGVDYWVVDQANAEGGGASSLFGLEWKVSRVPAPGAMISLTGANGYTFNRMPGLVEERIRRWSLVGTDARVHSARYGYVLPHLVVVAYPNYSHAQIEQSIRAELTRHFSDLQFGESVHISDILQVAHNAAGVDNVRLSKSTEAIAGRYGVQWSLLSSMTPSFTSTGSDIPAWGQEYLPVLKGVSIIFRAPNTF